MSLWQIGGGGGKAERGMTAIKIPEHLQDPIPAPPNPWKSSALLAHFTDEEVKAQSSEITCSKGAGKEVDLLGFNLRLSGGRARKGKGCEKCKK